MKGREGKGREGKGVKRRGEGLLEVMKGKGPRRGEGKQTGKDRTATKAKAEGGHGTPQGPLVCVSVFLCLVPFRLRANVFLGVTSLISSAAHPSIPSGASAPPFFFQKTNTLKSPPVYHTHLDKILLSFLPTDPAGPPSLPPSVARQTHFHCTKKHIIIYPP